MNDFFYQQDSTITFDTICGKCWQSLQQFSQYCEKIRSIHRDLLEAQKVDDDQTEILIEECEGIEQECENTVELLAIETNVGDDGCDTINRRNTCK